MVVLEPSCCAVFRDELNGLMPESRRAHRLMENTFTLAEFLEKKVKDYDPPKLSRKAVVQAHCHHKAIMRLYDDEAVMKKMGLDFQMLNAGCCGMAGSFGFEEDKYDISLKCGERALFPGGAQDRAFDAGDGRWLQLPGTDSARHAASRAAPRRSDAFGDATKATAYARCIRKQRLFPSERRASADR